MASHRRTQGVKIPVDRVVCAGLMDNVAWSDRLTITFHTSTSDDFFGEKSVVKGVMGLMKY
jgi:hypothetical protein